MECNAGDWPCDLARIADALSGGFDLNGFLATLLATLIGAGVAAATSFWLAERERPKPMWRVDARIPWGIELGRGAARVEATVVNIGDGVAYHPRVAVVWKGATNDTRGSGSEALLAPGEQMTAVFVVPVVEDPESSEIRIAWPKTLSAELEWHQPPRRRRTQRASVEVVHD